MGVRLGLGHGSSVESFQSGDSAAGGSLGGEGRGLAFAFGPGGTGRGATPEWPLGGKRAPEAQVEGGMGFG